MRERAMRERMGREANPELKQLVVEASRALAFLDADRLEELALSCKVLSQDHPRISLEEKREVSRQAMDARAEMAVFARVLEATRSNLKVMERLRELHADRLEYGEGSTVVFSSTGGGRSADGDN